MDDRHLLQLNPRKVIRCLAAILPPKELAKVEETLRQNVQQLMRLAQSHLRFARQAAGPLSWRQRVSRGYYSVYCASRALRLQATGYYSTDPGDHKKIGDLPDDFPAVTRWKDFLMKFRGDRNLADYDHSISETALELRSDQYLLRAEEFLRETRQYLTEEGACR